MMSKKDVGKRTASIDSLINLASYGIFICVIATSIFYGLKYFLVIKSGKLTQQNESQTVKQPESTWANYSNEEYGFSIDYPLYLYPTAVENPKGYLTFIIFEQTNFSVLKGMALGITKSSLEEEVSNIKKGLEKEDGAKLEEVKAGEKDGHKTVMLKYSAENKEEFEDKSIFVINDGRFTLSLSTVPEQIDRAVSSLKFF